MAYQKAKSKTKKAPKYHVKRGDTVMIITGYGDREQDPNHPNRSPKPGMLGKTGIVKRVFKKKDLVLVEGLNMVKKAVRPNPMAGQQGGLVEKEAPIHISNIMLYDLKTSQPTRVRRENIQGADGKAKRVRVAQKNGEQLDD